MVAGTEAATDPARQRLDGAIAARAAAERGDPSLQLEAIEHLAKLPARIGGMQERTVGEGRALEQADVAAQHDAMLGARYRQQFIVAIVVAIEAIEAEQTKISRQPAQMDVEDEARLAQRAWPQSAGVGEVEALEHRIDRDPFAAAKLVRERHRNTINEDQVDLGMRHAQGFDPVLHRWRALEGMRETLLPSLARQEEVQLLVKAKLA